MPRKTSRREPAFQWRAGVRVAGTTLACDAAGGDNELVFLSHAGKGMGLRGRAGRRQIVTTEPTLALLGRFAEPLRRRALVVGYGRPFALGELRLELFPSGHAPGSAALLVETTGGRTVFTGPLLWGAPALGASRAEVRAADAICVDATFGHPRFQFPAREDALAQLCRFVEDTLAQGRAPIVLALADECALDVANALAHRGIAVRGHRSIVQAATAYRAAGAPAPAVVRFSGKLGPGEALLWPPEFHSAPQLGALPSPCFAHASGLAGQPANIPAGIPPAAMAVKLSNRSDHEGLLAFTLASGATQIAVTGDHAEAFARTLAEHGRDANVLGPPEQMPLFAAGA